MAWLAEELIYNVPGEDWVLLYCSGRRTTVNPIKLEAGLRPNSAGIPYTLLLGIEAMGFSNFLASTVGGGV